MKLPLDAAREILQSSSEAIVVVNNDGEIVYVNRQAEMLFGYDAAEMIGKKIEMLMPEGVRHKHEKHRHRYSRGGGVDIEHHTRHQRH
jgi:PAS domain S-box-containing protein